MVLSTVAGPRESPDAVQSAPQMCHRFRVQGVGIQLCGECGSAEGQATRGLSLGNGPCVVPDVMDVLQGLAFEKR